MRPLLTAVALALAACGADRPAAPDVRLSMVGGADPLPIYVQGVSAWSPLGFDVAFGDQGEEPECRRRWYDDHDTACQITISVVRYPMLRERFGTNALSDRDTRSLVIDDREDDELVLELASAHEGGHILLDTAEHTAGGIMGGASVVMEDVDRALACRTIGICL